MTALQPEIAPHWQGLADVRLSGSSVVTIGVFDGVHRGHARVLATARRLADDGGIPLVLVTFDPHPATFVGIPRDARSIVGLEERVRLCRARGVDHVLVLPFDETFAATPAADFVVDVLAETLHATHVVVGEDFRFGCGAAGDIGLLRRMGATSGFTVRGVPLLPGCSSTRVRALVASGDLAGAATILGRPFRLDGRFIDGQARFDMEQLLPPPGHYRARTADSTTVVEIAADHRVRLERRNSMDRRAAVDLIERL